MSIPEWYQAYCWGLSGQIPRPGYGQRQHQKEDWCHLEAVQEVVHESTQKGGREKKGASGTISSRCSDGKISKQTNQLINYKLSCYYEILVFFNLKKHLVIFPGLCTWNLQGQHRLPGPPDLAARGQDFSHHRAMREPVSWELHPRLGQEKDWPVPEELPKDRVPEECGTQKAWPKICRSGH